MIDEWGLRAVDWAVETFTRWAAPWKVRLKRSFIGFRPTLIISGIKRTVWLLMNTIATAGEEDGFLTRLIQEPVEPVDTLSLKEYVTLALSKGDAFFRGKTFGYLLLLTMVTACLLAGQSARGLAALAAFFGLYWLAAAMDEEYEPISGGVRQKYLTAQLLRTLAYLTLLLDYFISYAQSGLETNVVLQGAMILTMIVHLACYVSFVAFNRRQQPFLRLLVGLMGIAPALACAAGIALAASTAARAPMIAAGGLMRAAGVMLAFISRQVEMIDTLGGGRIRFGRLWQGLTMTIGFFMMLLGAWFSAL